MKAPIISLYLASLRRARKRTRAAEYERDELAVLCNDLRQDVAALEQINAVLMRACPADASALFDQDESEAGT